ncbi:MAG: cytochrome c [Xanthomonadales bacterium]|nr:cytochrome c [Xanthomonadales bacterium]
MRELWARRLAAITGLMVVLLSAAFAAVQNPPADPAHVAVAADGVDAARLARGRAVLEANDCLMCHSIAGEGSPRSPLDGVGSRLSETEILHFAIADESVQDDLSPRAIKAKRDYAELPQEDLQAMTAYLASLK